VLREHRTLTEEYKRLKAQRPDWKTPQRTGNARRPSGKPPS
jgi:hypothetical protein